MNRARSFLVGALELIGRGAILLLVLLAAFAAQRAWQGHDVPALASIGAGFALITLAFGHVGAARQIADGGRHARSSTYGVLVLDGLLVLAVIAWRWPLDREGLVLAAAIGSLLIALAIAARRGIG